MTDPSGTPRAIVSPPQIGSVTPSAAGSRALTDARAETQSQTESQAQAPRVLAATQTLPPVGFKVPNSYSEVVSGGGSAAGYSAVSGWLTCPEAVRLRGLGLRRRPEAYAKEKLDALTFGTIAHCMRAIRLVYGHDYMLSWFWAVVAPAIPQPDATKLDMMFRIYNSIWPAGQDQFRILGVEVEVVTDVNGLCGPNLGRPVFRTVRYDTVILNADGGVYSFEAKTAARSSNMEHYNPQGMVQTAIWNVNRALVAQYGLMKGVLFDEYVKTETPKVDRIGPKYYSKAQQAMALRYLMYVEQIGFPVDEQGRYPQMLHACWGKFAPCQFIPLCHEDAIGMYETDADRAGTIVEEW